MARIPRGYIEGALCYVTSRGDNERELFKDPKDYSAYLELLKKYKGQYGFELFSFVLMPNHLHLLLGLKEGTTVSEIMHGLNSNYTKFFNGKYARKGHLLQERYKINLLEKAVYLLDIVSYIHLNPKTAGIVSDLKDYPYSSYPLYIGSQDVAPGIKGLDMERQIQEVLSLAKGASYADYLKNVSAGHMDGLAGQLRRRVALGSDSFEEKVKEAAEPQPADNQAQAPKTKTHALLAAGAAIIVLLALALGFYLNMFSLRARLSAALEKRDAELSSRLAQERAKVYKDLDEKYRADRVSYQAMAKRLEIERNKTKELQDKLVQGKAKTKGGDGR